MPERAAVSIGDHSLHTARRLYTRRPCDAARGAWAVQMYGGSGRLWACLLPPSALAVWSEVLITLEEGNVGINWGSLHKGITQEEPAFTAAQVHHLPTTVDYPA